MLPTHIPLFRETTSEWLQHKTSKWLVSFGIIKKTSPYSKVQSNNRDGKNPPLNSKFADRHDHNLLHPRPLPCQDCQGTKRVYSPILNTTPVEYEIVECGTCK